MENTFREGLLKGKNAFVTGGGSGINLGIAKRLAAAGARVAILGRTQEKLDAAAKEIGALGVETMTHAADVRDYPAVAEALKKTREKWGELDILVCGAAGNFPAPAIGISANGFKSVVDIDLLGTFNACRAAYEHLKKPGASIINISATQAFTPSAMQVHVCAAKAGVDMVTRTLALEWGGAGIRVNSITPGPIDETEGMRRLSPDEASRKRVMEAVPLNRYGKAEEIGDLALFLCSPAASFITGAVVLCDGGLSLQGSGLLMRAIMGG